MIAQMLADKRADEIIAVIVVLVVPQHQLLAGFYLDAMQAPWSKYFRMESYVTHELRNIIVDQFPADPNRIGISGHSMGGHGALTLALRYPDLYR